MTWHFVVGRFHPMYEHVTKRAWRGYVSYFMAMKCCIQNDNTTVVNVQSLVGGIIVKSFGVCMIPFLGQYDRTRKYISTITTVVLLVFCSLSVTVTFNHFLQGNLTSRGAVGRRSSHETSSNALCNDIEAAKENHIHILGDTIYKISWRKCSRTDCVIGLYCLVSFGWEKLMKVAIYHFYGTRIHNLPRSTNS